MSNTQDHVKRPTSERKIVLIVLLLSSMTNLMGASAVAPALPLIIDFFSESSTTMVTLIITIPSVVVAFAGFGIGALADRFGKVRTLRWGAVLFGLTGLAGFFFNSLGIILISRVFVGLGIAGISIATSALIATIYEGEQRDKAIALQAAFVGIGVLVLEYGGGLLANFGWHAPFLVYILGFIIYLLALFALRGVDAEIAEKAKNMPSPEELAAQSFDEGSLSAETKKAMTFAAVCGCMIIFLMEFYGFAYPGLLPTYVVEVGGTPAMSGLFLGFNGICLTLLSLVQPKVVRRFKRSNIIAVSLAFIVLSLLGLWAFPNMPMQGACSALEGAACGIFLPTLVQWVSSATTPKNSGLIMGFYTAALNMGQFVSSLILEPVGKVMGGTQGAFLALAFFALAMVIATLALSKPINKLK